MDYIKINKDSWNRRTEIHFQSDFYNIKKFIDGESSLNEIELNLLGDIKGKNLLHLQCHFGQDTISLNRIGAAATGVDFSETAIEKAKQLASEVKSDAKFVCCDVYDLQNHLNEKFDIVFSSYGVIGWLPDLDKWAEIITHFLKPGGEFILVEFHPVVWMFDDSFEYIKYNYFKDEPIIETVSGTYADKSANIEFKSVNWNHSLSEVINSLLNHGMVLKSFDEYDYSPYNCFENTVKIDDRKYRIKNLGEKIPMVFSLSAQK
ncbi:MAG: class I SAM-dependent methyltransferase [Melioribacteraceae bacterium]|nr:class I SAM-dependent methyltransferase [Melioribacteraceae bacterium]